MFVAVLEDDEYQAKVISLFLESAQHTFEIFGSGEAYIDSIQKKNFDLLILDWELPDTTGIEILKWIRTYLGWNKPVLFMTVRDSKEDIVTALEHGADDYMVKPVDRHEFLARINTLVRRVTSNRKHVDKIEYGGFIIYKSERKISHSGSVLNLTPKEYELATLLFESEGRLLPRLEILKTVWGIQAEINTRTVDTHISRIRKKLALEPKNGWKLSSIYHHGYRLERV
ncbi:MAG: response regulator transcription factor [Gammaproteobacteria bacterium]|nr:response regulator transcription factor [Gammaproteobacteria bacterium]